MVAVGMSAMPPKVIGREACLRAKGPPRLSKDFEPKGTQTFEEGKSQKK
jgi:hypothetical protein